MKRNGDDLFDVPMGSFHGAELCELIGLYILDKLKDVLVPSHYGLYRDDGLAVVETCAPCNPVKVERKIRKVLDDIGFKITIETGLKRTEFLDVKLDLCLDTFSPYRKPNNTTTYVNSKSNHPPSILKSIPDMVNQRLCRLSKNETAYKNNAHQYLKDLKTSGYNTDDLCFTHEWKLILTFATFDLFLKRS